MSVKTIITKRRSVRKYKDKQVSDILIKELIDAARLAPSSCNAQPTRFSIVKDEETKKRLKKSKIFKQDFVYKSPVILICCGDPKTYPRIEFEPGYDNSYKTRAVKDVSIASQNLVLRATELGLGTCYVGWMHKIRVKKVLGISNDYVVPFAITVGYSNGKTRIVPKKLLKELILN